MSSAQSAEVDAIQHNLFRPRIAASAIWRARSMFNVMLESVVEWPEEIAGATTERGRVTTVLPGFRAGWGVGEAQAIVGVGVPVTFADDVTDAGVFGYFSYELPFMRTR